jgi:hypothetical protein
MPAVSHQFLRRGRRPKKKKDARSETFANGDRRVFLPLPEAKHREGGRGVRFLIKKTLRVFFNP